MSIYRNLTNGIFFFIIICTTAIMFGRANSKWEIDNPYAKVNWSQYRQIKANLHTHTTESDGRMSPAEVIDEYHSLGYKVLSLTDHNKVTWPWEDYDRIPDRLEMVAIQGSEPSRHHHITASFCEVPGARSETETLAQVRKQRGVAVMAHPGRYKWSVEDYVALYREWNELIGMEIFNQGDRYPGDRQTWDKVLKNLMPEGRPVWGFSNDDMHKDSQLGRNWNVLLLPELSLGAVRIAIENGVFFFVYAPERNRGMPPPHIHSIKVDSQKGIIWIKATNYGRIEWISGGNNIHEGEMIDISTKTDVHGYIRAVIYSQDGNSLIGTQPFRIQRQVK